MVQLSGNVSDSSSLGELDPATKFAVVGSSSTSTSESSEGVCTSACCSEDAVNPFQPTSKEILASPLFNS